MKISSIRNFKTANSTAFLLTLSRLGIASIFSPQIINLCREVVQMAGLKWREMAGHILFH
jgi:hypothetical protein